jgi:hypothetical protein
MAIRVFRPIGRGNQLRPIVLYPLITNIDCVSMLVIVVSCTSHELTLHILTLAFQDSS